MKPLFKETLEPKPLVFEGSCDPEAYTCAHCGSIYHRSAKDVAKKCCQQYYCEDCGAETYQYHSKCSHCSDFSRMQKATLVPENDEYVYCPGRDKYYENIDEAREEFYDEEDADSRPDYLFCCTRNALADGRLDLADRVIDYVNDNHHEDAADDLDDLDGLNKFCSEWLKKQTLVSWDVDYKRKVKV